jgi:hypothetical protein
METVPAPGVACPYCLAGLADSDDVVPCPGCHTVLHRECWEENGGCAVYGCTHAPPPEPRQAVEIPNSYWGRETKPCASCGQEIMATALRCRFCGTVYASARPEGATEYQARTMIEGMIPSARKTVRWIFAVSCVPFLSPIGAVWGWWWQRDNRATVDALPPIDRALAKMGLIISVTFTIAIVALTALFAVIRGR